MMQEVVITANKTTTPLGNIAVPVQIIQNKTIQQNGSLRLKDILQEQAGLNITNGFGAGIQMQGLNPDYTLVLLNGEPMIGRTAGVLDLNRIGIANIQKIEIVKGPSSSLYGSEAMAGVINIITKTPEGRNFTFGLRYGFGNPDKGWALPFGDDVFKQTDINALWQFKHKNTAFSFSTDAFYVDGLSYRPYATLRIPQPIWRLTQQLNTQTRFTNNSHLNISFRHAYDHIKQEFSVANYGNSSDSYGSEINADLNLIVNYTHQITHNSSSQWKAYATSYHGKQQLFFTNKPDSQYLDQFRQQLYRLENQTDINFKKNKLTIGAGYTTDLARSTRYDRYDSKKTNTITYGFAQTEWKPLKKWIFIGGLRYDHNKLFAGAFSPKMAYRFNVNEHLSILGSIGRGFKAPDFRQLYLNFTNNAAGGYSVLGSIDAANVISTLQQSGLIAEIKPDYYLLQQLKPEFSTGINTGVQIKWNKKWQTDLNIFRNDITELIDVRQVATKTNAAQIFSYINIHRAFTQGFECNIKGQLSKHLECTAGYQLLITADKDELDKIISGKIFTRNADGSSRPLMKNEYAGLANRSKHMASLKLSYTTPKDHYVNLRFVYRSRWYVADTDGNGVYNIQDEHASGYLTMQFSCGMKISKSVSIYGGMDNITNYSEINYLPNLQGRTIYIGLKANIK